MAAPLLKDRIALVTGASRGLGAAVAKRFAREGAHVILAARTVGGLEEVDDTIQAAGGRSTLVPIDLADPAKIDQLGMQIAERFGRLDILIGNAAHLGDLMPLVHADPKMWDRVLAVNITANWRLLRILDPLLRKSDAGRAMFVTSRAATNHEPFWGPYAVSKAALDALVKTYAAEIATTNVKANIIDPGIMRTKMRAHAMPGEDTAPLTDPATLTDIFVTLAQASCTANGETHKAQKE